MEQTHFRRMAGGNAPKGIPEDEALTRTEKLNEAFPDALVRNYEPLIDSLNLPRQQG